MRRVFAMEKERIGLEMASLAKLIVAPVTEEKRASLVALLHVRTSTLVFQNRAFVDITREFA